MSFFPDDTIRGTFANDEQKQKRLVELSEWLGMFAEESEAEFGTRICIDPAKVSLLNTVYWETIEAQVRPRMAPHEGSDERVIDRHKIASAMELSICAVLPLDAATDEEKIELNARLAFYVGLSIIGNWNPDNITTLFVSSSFNREHLAWLREVNASRDFQIFSNAATWYLVEQYCLLKSSAIPGAAQ